MRPTSTPALLLLIASCILLPFQWGCQTNVATGRSQLTTLSREEEIQLGSQAMPELIAEYGGAVQSPQLQAYVTQVGMSLARHTEGDAPSLPWEFTVLDSDVINAFALPGGKVFITRGLMVEFDNEAQLAATLGHEVGHVTAEHVDERITQSNVVQTVASVAGAVAGTQGESIGQLVNVVVGTSGQGYLLKFGRDQESEADNLGIRYMIAAGYDPKGMVQVLEVLKRASGESQPLEILSTHPNPGTRLDRVSRLLATDYAQAAANPSLTLGAERYQQQAKPFLK